MAKKSNTFEKNINELSEIVFKMENNDLYIDESVELYKKGITIAKKLSKSLQEIEEEIFELKKDAEDIFTIDKNFIE